MSILQSVALAIQKFSWLVIMYRLLEPSANTTVEIKNELQLFTEPEGFIAIQFAILLCRYNNFSCYYLFHEITLNFNLNFYFRKADIYLLDDCLAALDLTVQVHISKKCIAEFLKGKICIWVTHSAKSIKEADQVLVLSHGMLKSTLKPKNINEEEIMKIIDNVGDFGMRKPANDENDDTKNEEGDEITALLGSERQVKPNLYKEKKKVGAVDWSVFRRYFNFGGGLIVTSLVFSLVVSDKIISSYREKVLSNW